MLFVSFSLLVVLFISDSHNYLTPEVSHQFHSRLEFKKKKMKKLWMHLNGSNASTKPQLLWPWMQTYKEQLLVDICSLGLSHWPGFKGRSQIQTAQHSAEADILFCTFCLTQTLYLQRNSNFICIQQQQKSQLLSIAAALQQSGAHRAACHKWFQMYLI